MNLYPLSGYRKTSGRSFWPYRGSDWQTIQSDIKQQVTNTLHNIAYRTQVSDSSLDSTTWVISTVARSLAS
jgi:hypothetical protein